MDNAEKKKRKVYDIQPEYVGVDYVMAYYDCPRNSAYKSIYKLAALGATVIKMSGLKIKRTDLDKYSPKAAI